MSPTYRYLLCDLLTDQTLAVLPLSGVTFDRRISRVGSFQGTLTAPGSRQVDLARLCHAYAGRSALWVYRDHQLWWGGIPWTVPVSQDERGAVVCTVTAATFDSYAHHRELYTDVEYVGADQGHIIPDLWRILQAEINGDIGVVADDATTGVLRDRLYLASEHAKVGKLIEDLGDVIDGPEHTMDVFVDSDGSRVKQLRVANRLGISEARAVFTRAARGGGRVLNWTHTADAVNGGTSFQTRGDAPNGNVGELTEPLLSERIVRQDLLDAGWPLLDVSEDRPGVIDAATLDGYAEALSVQQAGAMETSEYVVQVGDTGWTPNRVGDHVRIKLSDDWHETTDLDVRPVGCRVTAAEKGTPEKVTLLLGDED